MPHLSRCRTGRLASLAVVFALTASLGAVRSASAAVSGQDVVLTDQPFMCANYPQPLNLDLVKVTMTQASTAAVRDAVHLTDNCSGRIGRLEVDTWVADGVKVGSGAHDLVVQSGYIHCWGHSPGNHQDGIQAMGGSNVTFTGIDDRCYTANDSAMFVNNNPNSPSSGPTAIVCTGCTFQAQNSFGLRIYNSTGSGAVNSTICGAIHVTQGAINPVDSGNTVLPTCPPMPTPPVPATASNGTPSPPATPPGPATAPGGTPTPPAYPAALPPVKDADTTPPPTTKAIDDRKQGDARKQDRLAANYKLAIQSVETKTRVFRRHAVMNARAFFDARLPKGTAVSCSVASDRGSGIPPVRAAVRGRHAECTWVLPHSPGWKATIFRGTIGVTAGGESLTAAFAKAAPRRR